MKILLLILTFLVVHSGVLAQTKAEKIEQFLVAIDEKQVVIDRVNMIIDRLRSEGAFEDLDEKSVRSHLDLSAFLPKAVRYFESNLSEEDVATLWEFFNEPQNVAMYHSLAKVALAGNTKEWNSIRDQTLQKDPALWQRTEAFYRSSTSVRFLAAREKFSPLLAEFAKDALMKAVEKTFMERK